jgi:hypothetical protein
MNDTTHEPMIVVLLPVGGPDWLPSAMSVLAQTWPRWTLVLLGDEPPDSEEVEPLKVHKHVLGVPVDTSESQGYAAEWAMGLDVSSSGSIVAFLEPGMIYSPSHLATLAELFHPAGQVEPACDIVFDRERPESPSRAAISFRAKRVAGHPEPLIRPPFAEWIARLAYNLEATGEPPDIVTVRPLNGTEDPPLPENPKLDGKLRNYAGWWRRKPKPPVAIHP